MKLSTCTHGAPGESWNFSSDFLFFDFFCFANWSIWQLHGKSCRLFQFNNFRNGWRFSIMYVCPSLSNGSGKYLIFGCFSHNFRNFHDLNVHSQLAGEFDYMLLQSMGIWMSAVSCLMIYCACGDLVAEKGLDVAQASFETLWYSIDYPLDLKKFHVLIIAFSHRPIKISGLGVVQCSLSRFLSVYIIVIFHEQ